MKKTNILQSVCAVLAGLMIAGVAHGAALQLGQQVPSQCSVESKNQYYKEFQANHDGDSKDQAKAFEAAKKYLACPEGPGDQEEILAQLNLAVGRMLSSKESSGEAIPYLIKAASYNSSVKTSPQTYVSLAEAYENGPYTKMEDGYRSRFQGKAETEESLLAAENIYQIVDRIIDAYARAAALAGVELPKETRGDGLRIARERSPTDFIYRLVEFYKFRHRRSAGLKEMISRILSQPLPSEPVPLTSLPAREKKEPGPR